MTMYCYSVTPRLMLQAARYCFRTYSLFEATLTSLWRVFLPAPNWRILSCGLHIGISVNFSITCFLFIYDKLVMTVHWVHVLNKLTFLQRPPYQDNLTAQGAYKAMTTTMTA